ncbi:expressed protein [Phakopsora pachyrhizi]|uniref:Expressed protein n=1 Tax=Phakopsora pachyrhizi TaxID=170000 RepID=A0AAV0AII4_PHAPC|nr:expressed protein [Phakopsora pachyrhizi]
MVLILLAFSKAVLGFFFFLNEVSSLCSKILKLIITSAVQQFTFSLFSPFYKTISSWSFLKKAVGSKFLCINNKLNLFHSCFFNLFFSKKKIVVVVE